MRSSAPAIGGACSGESLAHCLEMGVSLGESLELVGQLGLEGDRALVPGVEDRNDPTRGPLAPSDLTLALELLALEPRELDARGGLLRDPLVCPTPPLLRHLGRLAGTLGCRRHGAPGPFGTAFDSALGIDVLLFRHRADGSLADPPRNSPIEASPRGNSEAVMNEDTFNIEVRKFLKQLGVTSQREIESAVRRAVESGRLQGDERLKVSARVQIEGIGLDHRVEGEIALS